MRSIPDGDPRVCSGVHNVCLARAAMERKLVLEIWNQLPSTFFNFFRVAYLLLGEKKNSTPRAAWSIDHANDFRLYDANPVFGVYLRYIRDESVMHMSTSPNFLYLFARIEKRCVVAVNLRETRKRVLL